MHNGNRPLGHGAEFAAFGRYIIAEFIDSELSATSSQAVYLAELG